MGKCSCCDKIDKEDEVPKPKPLNDLPLMMLPSSAVAARLGGGWEAPSLLASRRSGRSLRATTLRRDVLTASQPFHPAYQRPFLTPVPPGYAHLPLMHHPKQRMPHFYGRTLHIGSSTGIDPRAS